MRLTQGLSELINAGLVLVGSVFGYVLAGFNDSKRDSRLTAREEVARKQLIREKRAESTHQFQLDTLLALQDALRLLARTCGLILIHDQKSLTRDRVYARLDTQLSDEAFNARIDYVRLLNRVTNDDLRFALSQLNERTTVMVLADPHLALDQVDSEIAKIEAFQNELAHLANEVGNKVGESLRELLKWEPVE